MNRHDARQFRASLRHATTAYIRPRSSPAADPESWHSDAAEQEAISSQVLAGYSPRDVLQRLPATPGLVVLSGEWAGGGMIIARDPVTEVTDFAALRTVLDAPHSSCIAGGWFGWLAYPQPGTRPLWFGRYPNILRYDRHSDIWHDEAVTGVVPDQVLATRRGDLVDDLHARRTPYRVGDLTPNVSRGRYASAVEQAISRIRDGDIYQVNLCLQLEASFDGDVISFFIDMLDELNPAYAALVCTPSTTVVSMSPELFLRRNGRTVTSAPIKGTRPRTSDDLDDSQAQQLRQSTKERAENVMIVDLVRNDLGRVAETGSVTVPSLLLVEPHCGVWHLVSTISAEMSASADDTRLLEATFPPGSITGAPKQSAQAVIDSLEDAARGVYTGAVGYISPSHGLELNVAIRTFELHDRSATLGVGAGITAGSTPAAEWHEPLAAR